MISCLKSCFNIISEWQTILLISFNEKYNFLTFMKKTYILVLLMATLFMININQFFISINLKSWWLKHFLLNIFLNLYSWKHIMKCDNHKWMIIFKKLKQSLKYWKWYLFLIRFSYQNFHFDFISIYLKADNNFLF
jgi:hypothetical protein